MISIGKCMKSTHKGVFMKKSLKSFFVATLMLLVTITLVACSGSENEGIVSAAPFGTKYPERIKAKYSINANMNALKMYETAVKNYNEIDFVASRQIGTIMTDSIGGKLKQSLDSTKIKQDNKLYLETNTITIKKSGVLPAVNIIDQSIYEDGVYRFRSVDKNNISVKDGTPIIKEWESTKKYNNFENACADGQSPNNPSRINMYNINDKSLISSTKPIYDAKNKVYKFELVLDNSLATKDYIKNMEYNASKGGVNSTISFTQLKLSVEVWSDGLIKSISTDETYDVKAVGLTNKTAFVATTYFTYDKTECDIKNYIKF